MRSRTALLFPLLLLAANPAAATWTIVAVDPATGEVGSAGASCTPFVAGVARLVPGRGAVVAQAASNMMAKDKAATMIADGAGARAIVATVSAASFDRAFATQQYGVALIGRGGRAEAAAFTGSATAQARGHRIGANVAVQGNILVSTRVIDASFAAFQAHPRRPLSARLLLSLEAGSRAGGDARCPGRTAQSAYLGVAKPTDSPSRPSVRIVVGFDDDDRRNPVVEVRRQYDRVARSAD